VVILVENWAKKGSIIGVVEFNVITRRENFGNMNPWIYNPRVVKRNTRKTQIFIKVQISLGVRDLAQAHKKYCQENKIKKYSILRIFAHSLTNNPDPSNAKRIN